MVDICQQCGDGGFPEALNYCKQCQVYQIHRYCLDTLPKKLNEYATWFCEDCETKEVPRIKSKVKYREKRFTKRLKKKKKKKVKKKRHDEIGSKSNVKIGADVGQSIPPLQLAEVHCSDKNEDSRFERPEEPVQEDGPIHGEVTTNDITRILGHNYHVAQPIVDPEVHCSDKNEDSRLERPGEPVQEDGAIHGEVTTNEIPQILGHAYHLAQPIVDPVWRGGLKFGNKSFRNVCAHMSSLACSKVYEEAKMLPEFLSVEIFHRLDVWPKGFAKWGPTDQSIALYFFPEEKRSEKAFDILVNAMMCKDLALRAVLKNSELLVFTSFMLPKQYWRFQMRYYLWGVFRGKQASQWINNVVSLEKDFAESLTSMQSPVSPLSNTSSLYSTSP